MRMAQRLARRYNVSNLKNESIWRKGLSSCNIGPLGYEAKVNYHQSTDITIINLVVQKPIVDNRYHHMYRFHFGCNTDLGQFHNGMVVEHDMPYSRDENLLNAYTQGQTIIIDEYIKDLKELD